MWTLFSLLGLYLLRCTRRCHTPFMFYISYSLISINAGSFGEELVN
jgi:hypothetical protein